MSKMTCLVICFLSCTVAFWAEGPSWEEYKEQTIKELPLIRGWCSKEKAERLMDCILQWRPDVCVEIGTFGGSTTYPLARALQYAHHGALYTIDAWENAAALEGIDRSSACVQYWNEVDMEDTYRQFTSLRTCKGLESTCHVLRMRSEVAVDKFADESIDLLFVDGNFSPTGTLQDILLYFPKVKTGGYIWLTNPVSDWKSRAVAFLMKNCTWIKSISLPHDWIVLRKECKDLQQQTTGLMLTQ